MLFDVHNSSPSSAYRRRRLQQMSLSIDTSPEALHSWPNIINRVVWEHFSKLSFDEFTHGSIEWKNMRHTVVQTRRVWNSCDY